VPDQRVVAGERVRAAEIVAALCLATDLGVGFPFEHGLQGTLLAMRLAEKLEVDDTTASETFYASLLIYSGCTADAEVAAHLFEGELTEHFVPVIHGSPRQAMLGIVRAIPDPDAPAPLRVIQALHRLPRAARESVVHQRAICEVGEMLAGRLGLPSSVQRLFVHFTERWDGKGRLGRAQGGEVPLPLRIAHVGRDATLQRLLFGPERAVEIISQRSGHAFDPDVVSCFVDHASQIVPPETGTSAWEEVLAAEPEPHRVLDGEAIEVALAAMGDFADLISPHLTGHSSGVAALAAAAAERCGLSQSEVRTVRRAALVHDLGRVAVAARVWNSLRPLSVDEWEGVRLHAYHGERILAGSPFLAPLGRVASAHHERLDGSGYHRGATAAALSPPARILAAADAYHAMTEPRPHRGSLPAEEAADEVSRQVRRGLLDADAVGAVLGAAGQQVPSLERPAGLTEREVDVVALLARGYQTKQIARALGISAKTADRHIQHAYAKIGVSTRAAATLFAMEHGLVAWGELPMVRGRGSS
jgi:HD-GYP domain-containing protein (c-di-GMP phosphodiesterase class II)